MKRVLFIDRDGTIVEEPFDEQVDSFEKLKFVKGVFKNLSFICEKLDFELVMVSNQDGLGTASFPEETFWPVHNFILQTLRGEGISFSEVLVDRHFPEDNSPTRKPATGMVEKYMVNADYDMANSYVIGDRETDRLFAENIGCKSLILGRDGMTWDKVAEILFAGERVAEVSRTTHETDIYVKVGLDGSGKCDVDTGIGFFDHLLEYVHDPERRRRGLVCALAAQVRQYYLALGLVEVLACYIGHSAQYLGLNARLLGLLAVGQYAVANKPV